MNPEVPSSPENSTPSKPEESLQLLLSQAADAERDGFWDQSISTYQSLLKKTPNTPRLHVLLGRALEGKSRGGEEKAFLLSAMEHYRQALKIDPHLLEANEALLSAAYRAGVLEDLISEYRARYKTDPNNQLFQDLVKKAETLLSLPRPSKQKSLPMGRFMNFLVTRILPAAAVLSFSLSLLFALRPRTLLSSVMAHLSLWAGGCLTIVYIICWIVLSRA